MSDEQMHDTTIAYKSGFIAVVGRPNVGKSTLMNALVGHQVAITSSRPETTRKAIRGIVTTENAQIVLVDTPGIHRPRTLLGQRLNDIVDDSLSEIDAVAFLLPADQPIGAGDTRILQRLASQFERKHGGWKVPLIAIVTKIDKISREQLVNKLIEVTQFAPFAQIVPVSAVASNNVQEVLNVFIDAMPEGPQMYPADTITEESPTEHIAELVRGALLEQLNDELPHSLTVVVDDIIYPATEDSDDSGDFDVVHRSDKIQVIVSLYVERSSQKPIIIGKKAANLVAVKKKLRTPVNRILGGKAVLDLHVKVAKDWQSNPKQLDRLGF